MKHLESYLKNYWNKNAPVSQQEMNVKIEFYKYRATMLKIFRKDGLILLRYSFLLKDAPDEILKAGGREMIHRLIGINPLATDKVIFQQHINEIKTDTGLLEPTFKLLPGKGKYKNLIGHFNIVNKKYFDGSIKLSEIGWSRKPMKSYYAHYNRNYNRITFNLAFDNSSVPDYVIEYLIHHECLHIIYPPRFAANRLIRHTPELRAKDREFPFYHEAKDWLKKNNRSLIIKS